MTLKGYSHGTAATVPKTTVARTNSDTRTDFGARPTAFVPSGKGLGRSRHTTRHASYDRFTRKHALPYAINVTHITQLMGQFRRFSACRSWFSRLSHFNAQREPTRHESTA